MAYVLTSISGNLISAASAGYAPTNSADVSAIASSYQVVSSTSTQLYAGTAFLTEVNDAPVSASRAGQAANASMANSAYYDGTGRLISSLPDSAAVSSIASSYAESAASGKLDESASSNFYTTANESGFVDSAYVDSAVSGKQDTLTFAYDADSAISSINGSALAGGGGGATGDYVEKSAMEVAIGSGNDVSATSFAFGVDNFANSVGVAFGRSNYASASSLAVGNGNSASSRSFALGSNSRAMTRSMAFGLNASATEGSLAFGSTCKASMDSYVFGSQPTATDYSFAFGNHSIATNTSVAEGYYVSAHSGAVAFGKYNLHGNGHTGSGDSAAFVIGDGTGATARHDLMLVTKDGEITMYSSTADTAGTGIMSSIRAISAAATRGGVDSATVSAIASSYVESGVSSKLDTTAFNSGDFYTTANESGYVGSAYVDSAVSGKADSSALSSYVPYSSLEYNTASAISGINGSALAAGSTYSAGEGIDITDDVISVEAPVDIVAGPGIVVDNPDGNTLRVSVAQAEEVVLYSEASGSTTPTLDETLFNFDRCRVTYMGGALIPIEVSFDVVSGKNTYNLVGVYFRSDNNNFVQFQCTTLTLSNGGSSASFSNGSRLWLPGNSSDTQTIKCTKIVGVHRIANN